MTAPTAPASTHWHHLLLRLSGRLPDHLLAQARDALAVGPADRLAAQVCEWLHDLDIAVTPADAALLAVCLPGAAHRVSDSDVLPPYGLAPVGPDVLAEHGDRIPQTLDLAADPEGPGGPDGVDLAVIAAARQEPRPRGVWRVWRYPTTETPWAGPKRLYVVEAAPDAGPGLPALTARLQAALTSAGEADPLVESYADGDALPAFQRYARAYGALLWAAEEPAAVELARVFDGADPMTGPYFDPAHPRVRDAQEKERLLGYLDGGRPLLATGSLMDDVVEPARGTVVPITFRTDGRWIWTDAVAYYLRAYDLAPDQDMLAWIRGRDHRPPVVDGVAAHRAMAVLQAG